MEDFGKKVAKGSEAEIYEKNNEIIKYRNKKSYRIREIDAEIREGRNRREARILKKAREIGLPVPKVLGEGENYFIMEKIRGKKGKASLETAKNIGKALGKLHKNGIIHGDLTPANMIGNRIIDFGLSFMSKRAEDMADDLLASYYSLREHERALFKAYEDEFKDGKIVIERMEKIKGRVRYANDKGC
jgi:TP53 regulating kinase-like protein